MSKKEINEIMQALAEIKKDFQEHKDEVAPLLELVRGAVVGRRVILFVTTTIMGIMGAWFAVTSIFK
jgi:hypothetical protein